MNTAARSIGDAADREGGAGDEATRGTGSLALGARVEEPDGLLQEDRDADGGDERGEPGRAAQGPVGEALHQRRPCATEAMTPPMSMSGSTQRSVWPSKSTVQDGQGAEGADHEDLAVGEVDQLDDAVDHV